MYVDVLWRQERETLAPPRTEPRRLVGLFSLTFPSAAERQLFEVRFDSPSLSLTVSLINI